VEQNLLQQVWEVALAVIGGVAAFLRRVLNGELRQHWAIELTANSFIAAFAGLMTMYLGSAAGLSQNVLAAMVGVSGWMGVKALDVIAERWERTIGGKP